MRRGDRMAGDQRPRPTAGRYVMGYMLEGVNYDGSQIAFQLDRRGSLSGVDLRRVRSVALSSRPRPRLDDCRCVRRVGPDCRSGQHHQEAIQHSRIAWLIVATL